MNTTWMLKSNTLLAALALIALVASLGASCEDDSTGPEDELPPVPTVSTVAPSTVSPGDTVTIGGSDFATPARDNDVFFYNPLRAAEPFAGSATSLSVVVPRDAATGPVRVKVPGQPEAGVGPDVAVNRGVGDVWVFAGTGTDYPLKLPFPAGNSEYLLVPHSANPNTPYTQVHSYGITSGQVTAAGRVPAGSRVEPSMMSVRERFDEHRRRELEELMRTVDESALVRPGPLRGIERAPEAPAQFRQFNVLNTAVGSLTNPSSYTQVTAQLRYDGQSCLVYNDVDTLATGNFTQADYDELGSFFDTQGHPSDTTYFGPESDIDANGKVIILVSGIINGLAGTDPNWDQSYFIGGFFSSVDLFREGQSGIPAGTTNEAEIFYVLAADPDRQYLPPISFPRQAMVEENKQTLVHEFQHLISFSFRLFNFGFTAAQATWLEEGMAHMAEDLVGRNSSNIGRGSRYLDDPGAVSLENEAAPINQRGGIYLFLRYLGDRFGEDIYRQILQSRCVGRPCIESITGENFYTTFADFLATLYVSGRGITSDSEYNFTSIDLGDFGPLSVGPATVGDPISGTVFRTSGDFFTATNPGGSQGEFTFTQSSDMRLRAVVVRTR
jgi:hypothetical protein